MKKGIRAARVIQLLGAVSLTFAVTTCATGGIDGSGSFGLALIAGLVAVVGGKVYEFLVKE